MSRSLTWCGCMPARFRFYYEKNEPVTESDRYAICKQLSYHLGHPLEADAIWDEVLAVRPKTDPALREFLDTCIASCNKPGWTPAAQTDVTVVSKKHGIAGMIDRVAEDGTFSIVRAAGAMPFGTYAATGSGSRASRSASKR